MYLGMYICTCRLGRRREKSISSDEKRARADEAAARRFKAGDLIIGRTGGRKQQGDGNRRVKTKTRQDAKKGCYILVGIHRCLFLKVSPTHMPFVDGPRASSLLICTQHDHLMVDAIGEKNRLSHQVGPTRRTPPRATPSPTTPTRALGQPSTTQSVTNNRLGNEGPSLTNSLWSWSGGVELATGLPFTPLQSLPSVNAGNKSVTQ